MTFTLQIVLVPIQEYKQIHRSILLGFQKHEWPLSRVHRTGLLRPHAGA